MRVKGVGGLFLFGANFNLEKRSGKALINFLLLFVLDSFGISILKWDRGLCEEGGESNLFAIGYATPA